MIASRDGGDKRPNGLSYINRLVFRDASVTFRSAPQPTHGFRSSRGAAAVGHWYCAPIETMDEIRIRGARTHNLKNINLDLPREKLVMTGDFLTAGLSNMSDSFPDEWVTSLDALKKLDFDTVLPGHGDAFTDKAKIGYFQDYMRDVWTEVSRLKQQGVSAEDASKRADLTKHSAHLPINGPGVPLIGDGGLQYSPPVR